MMTELEKVEREALTCVKCKLSRTRTQVVFGVGNPRARILFIGEAPGFYEDQQGEPFVGAAGKLLDKTINDILGLSRKDVYITNVVKCRPPNNRDPEPDEIEACHPYLQKQLELISPAIICTLGNFATRTMLGKSVNISRIRGKRIEKESYIVVPTYHPAAILRNGNLIDSFQGDFKLLKQLLEEDRKPQQISEQPTLF